MQRISFMWNTKSALLLFVSLGFASVGFAQAGRTSQDPGSIAPRPAPAFDHEHRAWSALLAEHVNRQGLVNYRGLRSKRSVLQAYLESLGAVRAEAFRAWSATEREAYWINAYNAYTVRLILDHYPVESIKDIGSLFRSVFSKRFIPLQHLSAGHRRTLSLGEIEHEILAHDFELPLFHFAIVCASISCPELRAEAYVGSRLRSQLEDQARAFLADGSKNDTSIRGGRLRISKIFDWSDDDFERYPDGILGVLRAYGPRVLAEDPRLGTVKLRYREYDWSLNEWKASPSSP